MVKNFTQELKRELVIVTKENVITRIVNSIRDYKVTIMPSDDEPYCIVQVGNLGNELYKESFVAIECTFFYVDNALKRVANI